MGQDDRDRNKSRIKVLVGEDSTFMRRMIIDTLESDPGIKVVGTAEDGREVLRKIVELKPDCVTLDLEMPLMDGVETLRYIMSEWPTPVVILSAYKSEGAREALTSLEYGAVDFVAKTRKGMSFPVGELISKVRLAAAVDVSKVRFAPTEYDFDIKRSKMHSKELAGVVIIGASTGGPHALVDIIPRLPGDLAAGIIITQHMPPDFTRYLAERLDSISGLTVREAEEGDLILPGTVLVAPGGGHLLYDDHDGEPGVMFLPRNVRLKTACPSLDFAMTSFAPVFKRRLLGVVLTGMGKDGLAGCAAIRRYGGRIIAQDEATSMIFGMPGAVIEEGYADRIVPLHEIAESISTEIRELRHTEHMHES